MKYYIRDSECGFEPNSGVKHPDFDDSVITDITEFYRRFAADPTFKVRMLPPVYDVSSQHGTAADALIDCNEPEFGEQDLEYMDNLRRQASSTNPAPDVSANPEGEVTSTPNDD